MLNLLFNSYSAIKCIYMSPHYLLLLKLPTIPTTKHSGYEPRPLHCWASMENTGQPRPDSGTGFQIKGPKPFWAVPSSLGSGRADNSKHQTLRLRSSTPNIFGIILYSNIAIKYNFFRFIWFFLVCICCWDGQQFQIRNAQVAGPRTDTSSAKILNSQRTES